MKNVPESALSEHTLKQQIAQLLDAVARSEGEEVVVKKFPALTSARAQTLITEVGKKHGGEAVALCEELNAHLQLCNEIGVQAAFKRIRTESAIKFIAILMGIRQWDGATLEALLRRTVGIRQEVMDVLQKMEPERPQRLRLLLVEAESQGVKQAVINMLEWEKQKAAREFARNAELLSRFLVAESEAEERQIILEHPYLLSPLMDRAWSGLLQEASQSNSAEGRAAVKMLKAKWNLLKSLRKK